MKVMVVSHTYITTLNRDKWKVLAQQYPDVSLTVVFPQRWPGAIFQHSAHIDAHEATANYTALALPTKHEGNELLYYYQHKPLFTLIQTIKPDIIHVEQGANALCFAQINMYIKLLRLPTKTSFFTWVNWHPDLSIKSKIFLGVTGWFNRLCSSGAITGNNDAQHILASKGFNRPTIVLPQLGVNPHHFKPVNSETTKSQALCHSGQGPGIHSNLPKKYIGYIGRITPEKGVFYLVRAFLTLAEQFPDWSLVFIGKGETLHHLHSFVAHKHMLNRIEFCDPVPHDKIPTMLQKISLLVLPSYDTPAWREQFGHVLIEAMACKVPVLGSNAGEIPHVIGNAGKIFTQRNEAALRSELHELMSNETLRMALGELGYARVHKHYTHDVIAQHTYDFWQRVRSL